MKNVLLTALFSAFTCSISFSQNFSWAQAWGGNSYDHAYSVATDDSGFAYTTGFFQGVVDFDPGPDSLMLTSSNLDIFITKTSSTGQLVWVKQIGGSGADVANVIEVGANGNLYLTGATNGNIDFDPGPGTFFMNSPNGFALKLNSSGNFVWAKALGGGGAQLTLDQNENVYLTGGFSGTSDFDPGAGTNNLNGGIRSVYICKLTQNGDYVWARNFEMPTDSNTLTINSLAVDANQNIYCTGGFDIAIDFDPGAGTSIITPTGHEVFLLKLNTTGNLSWVKHFEQYDTLIPYGGYSSGNTLTLDGDANIYTSGVYLGVVDFNPGPSVDTLNSGLSNAALHYYHVSMYIAKYDSAGNYNWAKPILGNSEVTSSDIELNGDNEIYITGYFGGTVDFDPSAGVDTVANFNGQNLGHDIFAAKYSQQGNLLWVKATGGTHHDRGYSIALDGNNNAYVTGIFERTVDFDPGSDTWNLITTTPSSETPNAFLWKLSDCVPDKTVETITTCAEQYIWNLNDWTYTESGSYRTVVENIFGCDSIVTLDVTIPVYNNSISYNNGVLFANPNQPADSYQWIICNDTPIPGATESSFTPSENDFYGLVITTNGCYDTSACFVFPFMGMNEFNNSEIVLFPNPVQNELHIQLTNLDNISIIVSDVNGKIIHQKNNLMNAEIISTADWNSGVYFIKTESETKQSVHRIIKY